MLVRPARLCLIHNISHLTPIDVDFNPSQAARAERKEKMAKNERKHLQNLARAQAAQGTPNESGKVPQSQRKQLIDYTLATTRVSTASMGKFDRTLEGEKKLKGVKRKVGPNILFRSLCRY